MEQNFFLKYLKNNKRVLIHIAVWATFIGLNFLQLYLSKQKLYQFFFTMAFGSLAVFYLNYLYLVPRFLLKKKTTTYLVHIVLLITVPFIVIEVFFAEPFPGIMIKNDEDVAFHLKPPTPLKFVGPILFNLTVVIIGTAIRVYSEWVKNENKKREIEIQKSNAELHFLKTQLNPHFLFNSLNSIYSLTNKKSNDAPEAVITLSELMRYMLYQTDNEFVLLKDELEYIQNYLKLQRLRIANNENVTLNIRGSITDQKIKPLLLISFIENAFKYGTDFKGNTEVKIAIHIEDLRLQFECTNIIGNKNTDYKNSGIGLSNTKERLDLLYPDKHELTVNSDNGKFEVHLILNLQ
jgi:hypothetical protein